MNNKQKEDTATLEILQVIENNKEITQRHLADKLGVALGLANSYLKRCVRKGLVKIHQAPANRYFYYLTPQGFTEKSRLTAEYLSTSFGFYRRAGESCNEIFQICEKKNWNRIILAGLSDLTEIATLRAHEFQINILGIYSPDCVRNEFISFPVWNSFDELPKRDAFIVTELENIKSLIDSIKDIEPETDRILIPSILGFSNNDLS